MQYYLVDHPVAVLSPDDPQVARHRLVLVRGLPGSGKSTYARTLTRYGFEQVEADQFFMRDGIYRFDAAQLQQAHAWCLAETTRIVGDGGRVVVSNTFVRVWELVPYLKLMHSPYCVPTVVVTMQGNYGSIHGVPEDTMQRMQAQWEILI